MIKIQLKIKFNVLDFFEKFYCIVFIHIIFLI